MFVNRLPDDVLVRIFRCIKACALQIPGDWEKLLPLLAVCSRWRWLSAPVVYSSAFIVAQPPQSDTMLAAGAKRKTSQVQSTAYASNMLLALATGNAAYIRDLSIEADEIENVFAFLSSLARLSNAGETISWSKIQTLTLRQLCYRTSQGPRHQRIQRRMSNKFTGFITSKMPSISVLQCLIIDQSPQGSDIGNHLTDFYAGRLKRVKSLIPLSLSVSELSNQLTHLQMSMSNEVGHQIPRICKDSLKHMSLSNVPRNYKWGPFAGSTEQESIVFSQLEHLEIYYKLESHSASAISNGRQPSFVSPVTLRFPALKHLYLFRCYEHCQLLEASVLPTSLKNVFLNCSPTLLLHLLAHNWKHINKLNVNIEAGGVSRPELFLDCANILFGKSCVAERSGLTIGEIPMPLDVARIDWSRMSSLTIIYQIDVGSLLTLLDNMVNLSELTVLSLEVYNLPTRVVQELHESDSVHKSKAKSNLQYAKIHAVDIKPCGPNYLTFIRYFATKYTSLKNLNVSPSALFYTQALARSSRHKHPHLVNTNIIASDLATH